MHARHAGRTLWLEKAVVRNLKKPRGCNLPKGVLTDHVDDVINHPEIKVVASLIGGLEPERTIMLRLLESGRSDKPYQALQEYCNTEVTILWLGQHLTTDIKNSGSRAAAEVHDRVREDLLVDDMRDEAATRLA